MAKGKRRSIEQFRKFVQTHPHLRNEVKQKEATWQELFEEWYILGENHPRWDIDHKETGINSANKGHKKTSEKEEEKKDTKGESTQELIGMLLGAVKNMDVNQIQQYIKSANQAIGTIQGLLEMFQGNQATKDKPEEPKVEQRRNPFLFRKD